MVNTKFKKVLVPWNKGKNGIYTQEQLKRMSEAQKKRMSNPEVRKRMSESHKGQIPWNKGKKGLQVGWMKGKHLSEESKRKISEAFKGKKLSEEHRKKLMGHIPWNKGKSPSEETIKKQKETWRKTLSNPETRKKISQRISEANKGKPSWNKGIPMREESKRKMSETVKTAWANAELRKRQSESHKGLHLSPKTEFKGGLVPWMKGKHHSEESRRKMKTFRNTPEYLKRAKEQMLKQYESGDFPLSENTKIERLIKAELLKRGYKEGIDFIHQYNCLNKFMCDFGFPKQKVVVEAYGDYWHCNPKLYSKPISQHQIKGIRQDKSKEAYITKADNHSWTYLVLWESDIQKDVAKCVDKIEEVLKNKK